MAPTDRRADNGTPISVQTLSSTAKLYGPIVVVIVAGAVAWVTLDLTVGALAGDSKEHQEKIEENQQAIAVIRLEAAVRKARDQALQDVLKDIKEGIKDLKVRRE